MDTIHGFWAGAAAAARRIDIDALARGFGGWSGLARASVDDLVTAGVPLDLARTWLTTRPLTTRGRALTRACPDYPPALARVTGAPPVLFVEGDPAALATGAIAVVGTRGCSGLGANAAHQVASSAARAGLVVISGLARGIDAYAHRAAITAGGRSVAVLGHGLDHTSPISNRPLRADLVASGGAVVTAWPDAVAPAKWTFPERNRWIAALSRRVVVVEAPERSGALITAEHLAEAGREDELWVVPGPLGAESWAGSARLISMGAHPLVEIDAFLRDVGGAATISYPDWLSALFGGASLPDAAEMRGMSAVALLRELAGLELEGRVVRLPGGRYGAGGGMP
jgi:DNA processing protein